MLVLMSHSPLGPARGDHERAAGSTAASPQTQPNLVRVYVYTDASGEAPDVRARRDSVKDLRAALAEKKKDLVLVDTEGDDQVSVEVVDRTVTIPKFAFGPAVRPGQGPGAPGSAGPVREVHLRVRLTRGDESVVFNNKNKALESGGGWKSAANDIAKQIDKWIVDRRAQILRVP